MVRIKSFLPERLKLFKRVGFMRLRFLALSATYAMRMPYFTALLWIFFSKKLGKSSHKQSGSIFVFDSPGGVDDLRAAFGSDFFSWNVFCLDGEIIKHLFRSIFRENYSDYQYNSAVASRSLEHRKYHLYLAEITKHLKNRLRLQAFVNFNFVYHAQRELMRVAREQDVRFISLMKECLRTKGYWESTLLAYQDRIGLVFPSAIFVHNSETYKLVVESRICPDCELKVVGQGRSDRLIKFRHNKIRSGAKYHSSSRHYRILYFAISETAGLPYFGPSSEFLTFDEDLLGADFSWKELASSTLEDLCNYVLKNSNVELVVKGKPSGVYGFKTNNSSRIKYYHGNPDIDLFESIDLVVGFNTTGLFEAIAAGIPVISSELGIDRHDMVLNRFLYEFDNSIAVASDRESFIKLLDQALHGDYVLPEEQLRIKILDRYLGNPDGKAGLRIKNAFLQHINGKC